MTSAPKGEPGRAWGDTYFAEDLAEALRELNQDVSVVSRAGAGAAARETDDVVLVLRGLRRVHPRRGNATWLLWVISHPELVDADEPRDFDAVFAASESWSARVPVTPLLQATNPRTFHPKEPRTPWSGRVLFVGNTRGEFRPIVRDAVAVGAEPMVYGSGWQGLIPDHLWAGEFLPHAQLPLAYASARVVLNDHWRDMAEQGFLSNRLFDAVAAGAAVVSDGATGLADVFGSSVRIYRDADDLGRILGPDGVLPTTTERRDAAARIARDHSFRDRAEVLLSRVNEIRGVDD
ncbi:MAG: glycosyltransferase [Actinobacteria bacterium]|nr:glycosyltransferase [Actinomycetota bacterium]